MTQLLLFVSTTLAAVWLFLATNGPSDWGLFWHELTHPPADARHAVRRSPVWGFHHNSPHNPLHRFGNLREQYLNYVKAVEEALANQLKDHNSRSTLVRRFFIAVTLTEDNVDELANILKTFNTRELEKYKSKLIDYTNNKVRGPTNRREMRAKVTEFIGHFERIMSARDLNG